MGLFGLFGQKDKEKAEDRCNECGMTSGRHTDWCPVLAEDAEAAHSAAGSPPTKPSQEPPAGSTPAGDPPGG